MPGPQRPGRVVERVPDHPVQAELLPVLRRQVEDLCDVVRLALRADGEAGRLARRRPADLGDPESRPWVAEPVQDAARFPDRCQRIAWSGRVWMQGGGIEQPLAAASVEGGDEVRHVDSASWGGEEAAEHDAGRRVGAPDGGVESAEEREIVTRIRRRLPKERRVRLVPELPQGDRQLRQIRVFAFQKQPSDPYRRTAARAKSSNSGRRAPRGGYSGSARPRSGSCRRWPAPGCRSSPRRRSTGS